MLLLSQLRQIAVDFVFADNVNHVSESIITIAGVVNIVEKSVTIHIGNHAVIGFSVIGFFKRQHFDLAAVMVFNNLFIMLGDSKLRPLVLVNSRLYYSIKYLLFTLR